MHNSLLKRNQVFNVNVGIGPTEELGYPGHTGELGYPGHTGELGYSRI